MVKSKNNKSASSLAIGQSFNDRMKLFEKVKKENVNRKREESSKNELKECTFKPKIKAKKKSQDRYSMQLHHKYLTKKRNINEFLEDQKEFEDKRIKRLEEKSKERERQENTTFRPKIHKKSKVMKSHYELPKHSTVYERLHELSKEKGKEELRRIVGMTIGHSQSQSTIGLKKNYLRENFKITDVLAKKSSRSRSKDIKKRTNLHSALYNDAFKRKIEKVSKLVSFFKWVAL